MANISYPCECPGCTKCDDIDATGAARESSDCQRAALVHITDGNNPDGEYRSCGTCADDAIASGEGWYARVLADVKRGA